MTELSPSARAILEAVTWKKYDVPPEGLPAFAEEMAPLLAAALRAVVDHCVPDDSEGHWVYVPHVLALAAELEGPNYTPKSQKQRKRFLDFIKKATP